MQHPLNSSIDPPCDPCSHLAQVGAPCEGWTQLSQAAALLADPHKERLTFRQLRMDVCPQLSLRTLQRLVVLMERQQQQAATAATDAEQEG